MCSLIAPTVYSLDTNKMSSNFYLTEAKYLACCFEPTQKHTGMILLHTQTTIPKNGTWTFERIVQSGIEIKCHGGWSSVEGQQIQIDMFHTWLWYRVGFCSVSTYCSTALILSIKLFGVGKPICWLLTYENCEIVRLFVRDANNWLRNLNTCVLQAKLKSKIIPFLDPLLRLH